jgi:hypothetical protein
MKILGLLALLAGALVLVLTFSGTIGQLNRWATIFPGIGLMAAGYFLYAGTFRRGKTR